MKKHNVEDILKINILPIVKTFQKNPIVLVIVDDMSIVGRYLGCNIGSISRCTIGIFRDAPPPILFSNGENKEPKSNQCEIQTIHYIQ
jgi:hypothetical protein